MDGVHVSMTAGLTWNHDLCRRMKWSLVICPGDSQNFNTWPTAHCQFFFKTEERANSSFTARVLRGFRSIGPPVALHGSCGHVYSTP